MENGTKVPCLVSWWTWTQMTANGSFNMKQLNDEKTPAMFAFGGVPENSIGRSSSFRQVEVKNALFWSPSIHQTPVGTIDLWTFIKNKQPGTIDTVLFHPWILITYHDISTPGYKGKAVITPCAKNGEPYKLTGCDPIMCLAPSAADKIDYQVGTLENENGKKNTKFSLFCSLISKCQWQIVTR